MSGQTRKKSLLESLLNVLIGYGIAVLAQLAIFPLFNIHVPLHDNLLIGALFTVVSIVRSYLLRRLFNWLDHGRGRGV
jgi:Kef-type K+ transport system membrane component KefB